MPTVIEEFRKRSITRLFRTPTFLSVWSQWKNRIHTRLGATITPSNVIGLGDHLSTIFQSTGGGSGQGRSQSSLSAGGVIWECLVCWYLNLCLANSRTIVIKQHRELMPSQIRQALTVTYGNFPSNTESDLVAITFPNKPEYAMDFPALITHLHLPVGKRDFNDVISKLIDLHFSEIRVTIIQCKTNWNDNAQIPMLWDIVYSSDGFSRGGISLGSNAYSITGLKSFNYSFITVPSQSDISIYTPSCTAVRRVAHLSGCNFWGRPTVSGVALSIKEIFTKTLNHGANTNLRTDLQGAVTNLQGQFSYFQL